MKPNLKTFKSAAELIQEIQRRSEIILRAHRVFGRRVFFEDIFHLSERKCRLTFKGNYDFILASAETGNWVMAETHIAACARWLSCLEMKAAKMQSLDAIVAKLHKDQINFLEDYDDYS